MHVWLLSDNCHELGYSIHMDRLEAVSEGSSTLKPMMVFHVERKTILYHAPVLIYPHLPKLPSRQSEELGIQRKCKSQSKSDLELVENAPALRGSPFAHAGFPR